MSILIIDDSSYSQLMIQSFLKSGGYSDILIAQSAIEAYFMLDQWCINKKGRIDLILMDIIMPNIDGIEACQRIKQNKTTHNIPIIIVTSKTDIQELQLAFSVGAVDYLTKPINKIELLARVDSAIKQKKETDSCKERELELLKANQQLKEVNRILQNLSLRDGLTGVANRRHFNEELTKEINRSKREKTPLSLIMFDIDFFKLYNDTYGHLEGDNCLRMVASAAKNVLKRPGDYIARYGGEEFMVILPNTHLEGASEVAEQIRAAIENLQISHITSKCKNVVTVSLGISGFKTGGNILPKDLIMLADQALYESKNTGRNKISIFIYSEKDNHKIN